MAHTFHAERAARRTERVSRARYLAAAEQLADTLESLADRREEQHLAEMLIAETRQMLAAGEVQR